MVVASPKPSRRSATRSSRRKVKVSSESSPVYVSTPVCLSVCERGTHLSVCLALEDEVRHELWPDRPQDNPISTSVQ